MKKLMLLAALFAIVNFASAQKSPSAAPAKKEVKAADASKITTSSTSTSKKVKKDGTPDMRFKTNKEEAAKAGGPKKKDGTPDMRYKANKSTTPKKKEVAPTLSSKANK